MPHAFAVKARVQPGVVQAKVWMLLIHPGAIALWALFYWGLGCLPDWDTGFFSGVTYTTTGYGDVVLPQPFRLCGPVQALVGFLMCSLSTGLFFTVVNRLYIRKVRNLEPPRPDAPVD